MNLQFSRKQFVSCFFGLIIWIFSILLEDKVKNFFEPKFEQLNIDSMYFLTVTLIFVIIYACLITYWKVKDFTKELTKVLYDHKMRLDFMSAVIVHNSELERLSDISISTVKKMKLTPEHFEYFGYDEAYIKAIFPNYKKSKS